MPRILVVDDDANLRLAIRRMLEPSGFEVEDFADARDALRAIRVRPIDLVLCDVFMPEMDGLEFLSRLAGEADPPKVVSMSGGGFGGTMDMLPMTQWLGASGMLAKPFSQAELLALIRELLPQPVG